MERIQCNKTMNYNTTTFGLQAYFQTHAIRSDKFLWNATYFSFSWLEYSNPKLNWCFHLFLGFIFGIMFLHSVYMLSSLPDNLGIMNYVSGIWPGSYCLHYVICIIKITLRRYARNFMYVVSALILSLLLLMFNFQNINCTFILLDLTTFFCKVAFKNLACLQ